MLALVVLLLLLLIGECGAQRRGKQVDWRAARQISLDTFFLGQQRHPFNSTRHVHGYAFAHPAHSLELREQQLRFGDAKALHFARLARAQSAAPPPAACARPIAAGVRWRASRGFFLNVANRQGLSAEYLERATLRAVERWQCVLGGTQQRLVLGPLLDVRRTLSGDDLDLAAPNGRSEIGLGTLANRPGTIALTVLWGVFEGPLAERELVEFDMIFDESRYIFGNASAVLGVIDYESTATHEFGHAHGLDDIYEPQCNAVTMFGTSARDETHKRTLEQPDTAAVLQIYSA